MSENGNDNGRRWYDSTKIIAALAGLCLALIGIVYSTTYGDVRETRTRVEVLERDKARDSEKLDRIQQDVKDIKDELRRKP